MSKLTDTQLVILSTAATRDDGAVLPLPDTLRIKGGAVTSVLESLLGKYLIAELPATQNATVWREAEGGDRVTLVITDNGLRAIGVEPENAVPVDETAADAAPDPQAAAIIPCAGKPVVKQPKACSEAGKRPNTTDHVLGLLRHPEGASIAVLQEITGWQPHSIRAALTGLRKRGHTITRDKSGDGETVYRLAGGS